MMIIRCEIDNEIADIFEGPRQSLDDITTAVLFVQCSVGEMSYISYVSLVTVLQILRQS